MYEHQLYLYIIQNIEERERKEKKTIHFFSQWATTGAHGFLHPIGDKMK